ncbi:MAG: hypothetical protein KF752_09555 [Pirellulaceae bacterium]|nr:hypothetical protein [Pirellulaceae bacterium]
MRRVLLTCQYCVFTMLTLPGGLINAATNQSLEGQMAGLAADVKDFLNGDRLLKGQKLRLDRVSSSGMPDANYDQFIEQQLTKLLEDVVDSGAALLLKVEYSYQVSETESNRNNRVIQIIAKVLERGRTKKTLLREVNNTSDISRVLGNTQAPADSVDYQVRLTSTEKAFEQPAFKIIGKTQVSSDTPNYSVEIRKRSGGKGDTSPVVPVNENGRAFAPIDINDTYEIVLYNYDSLADAVAKVDIDGLDAINTFSIDLDSSGQKIVHQGYFIPRATNSGPGIHIIPGWLHTLRPGNDNVFEFVVNELGRGAASSLNVRGKTGVITVRFFDAYKPTEQPRGRNFGETGKGQPRKQDYALIETVVGSEPLSVVTVRYSRSPQ